MNSLQQHCAPDTERVGFLYKNIPRFSALDLGGAIVTTLALGERSLSDEIVVWICAIGVVLLVRHLLLFEYRNTQRVLTDPTRWENFYALTALFTGSCFASLSFLLPLSPEQGAFLYLFYFGQIVARGFAYHSSWRSFICFALPLAAAEYVVLTGLGVRFSLSDAFALLIPLLAILGLILERRRTMKSAADASQQVQALQRTFKQVFDNAGIAMALVLNRKIMDCNDQCAAMFGYTRDELVGQSSRIFYREDATWEEFGEIGINAMQSGTSVSRDIPMRHKSGTDMVCDSTVSSLIPGLPELGVVATLTDVTATRRQASMLRESLLRQTVIFETAPVGIATFRNHVVEECNEFMAQLLGSTRGDLVGNTSERWFLSSHQWESRAKDVCETLARGEQCDYEEEFVRTDGSRVWCRVRGGALDSKEPVSGLSVYIFVDVTAQKIAKAELVKSQHQMALVLASSNSGIWDFNLGTNQLTLSDKFYEMLGIAPTCVENNLMRVIERIHPEDRERMEDAYWRHVCHRERIDETFRVKHECGTYLWVRGFGQAEWNANGHAIRFVGCINDVSETKRQEEEIKLQLEALKQAKLVAESASTAKSEFLANMSHEIRTPISAIIGLTQVALLEQPPEKHAKFLVRIDQASKTLLGVINDVLDFERIEAGRLDLEMLEFDVRDVSERVKSLVQQQALDKKIGFDWSIATNVPKKLTGDAARITQVLLNICSNAVKFTETGRVSVSISFEQNSAQNSLLRFAVLDTGIGITKEDLNRLFLPFSQADSSTTRRYGGSGLGLVICKRLVELMGGEITVASERGKGTKVGFTVLSGSDASIQEGESEKKPAKQYSINAPSLIGKRILIADDNETNLDIASALLRRTGAKVMMVGNGKQAMQVLNDALIVGETFDLLLLDIQMPELDGYDTARLIRADSALANIPIIAITASAMKHERAQCFAVGMNAVIAKPFFADELYGAIQSALGVKRNTSVEQVGATDSFGYARTVEFRGNDLLGFNTRRGIEQCAGDLALYMRALDNFGVECERSVRALRDSMDDDDSESVARILHNLKGLAALVGADEIYEVACSLEEAVRGAYATREAFGCLESLVGEFLMLQRSSPLQS